VYERIQISDAKTVDSLASTAAEVPFFTGKPRLACDLTHSQSMRFERLDSQFFLDSFEAF